RFPMIFEALADGRLDLTGVNLLAPYLTEGNATEILTAAFHKKKAELEQMLAERFPVTEMMALVEAAPSPCSSPSSAQDVSTSSCQLAPARVPFTTSRVEPIAPERYALHLSMPRELRNKLQHAQDLLGHRVPSGDIAQVLSLALDALIGRLEKRKFAATDRPRAASESVEGSRGIPASIRRAVWERD